jgi:hypothetical protein
VSATPRNKENPWFAKENHVKLARQSVSKSLVDPEGGNVSGESGGTVLPNLGMVIDNLSPNLGNTVTVTTEVPATIVVKHVASGEIIPTAGGNPYAFVAYRTGAISVAASAPEFQGVVGGVVVATVAPSAITLVRTYDLPASPFPRTPSGFTCTGMAMATAGPYAGCLYIGDDGRLVEGDASQYNPALVVVDLRSGQAVVRARLPVDVLNSGSVQGVTEDVARGGMWVARASKKTVEFFTYAGVKVPELTINFLLEPGVLVDWLPNAIAYVASLDQLIVMTSTGLSVRRFFCNPADRPGGVAHVPNVSYNLTGLTGTSTNNSPDQFYYDTVNQVMYTSVGTNTFDGRVYTWAPVITTGNKTASELWLLAGSKAIEGIWYVKEEHTLYVANDFGYHNGGNTANKNQLMRYLVPPRP